ncbi:Clp protease N-terminal domain-containing protein [Streptacidiphilus cavernicola]|uniref:Clp protease N-terminal domain-containing protein n=1 Tax=Streptacidiphilus cavernicola TaxID=3342716 RepID=A0ABV6W4P3_9ACTN
MSLNLSGSIPGASSGHLAGVGADRFAAEHLAVDRAAVERLERAGALEPVAARARRRAVRAGDAEVDTGHLLHALLESDQRALGLLAQLPTQSTRLMGYLAQRSIGFGRDWRPGEGAGAPRARLSASPGWSRSATAALGRAGLAALIRDGGEPDSLDLLAELVSDPESRAAEVLLGAGVDLAAAAARVRAVAGDREGAGECEESGECDGSGEGVGCVGGRADRAGGGIDDGSDRKDG